MMGAKKTCEQLQKTIQNDKYLVGGWTNPFEKYARQIGSFLQGSESQIKNIWVATT